MVQLEMAARLARCLSGTVGADDLDKILLYLRERSRGRETIAEVGDFVAHRRERVKGISTERVRDFFAVTRFKIRHLGKPTEIDKLPKDIPLVLRGSLRQLSENILKRETGLRKDAAGKLLEKLIQRLRPNGNDWLSAAYLDEASMTTLLRCLTSFIVSAPAFTDERLFREFRSALYEERLLRKDQDHLLTGLRSRVILCAATAMHQSKVALGDGTFAVLSIRPESEVGHIQVMACAPVESESRCIEVGFPMFSTSIRAIDFCEADVLAGDWERPLEVNREGRLARIG